VKAAILLLASLLSVTVLAKEEAKPRLVMLDGTTRQTNVKLTADGFRTADGEALPDLWRVHFERPAYKHKVVLETVAGTLRVDQVTLAEGPLQVQVGWLAEALSVPRASLRALRFPAAERFGARIDALQAESAPQDRLVGLSKEDTPITIAGSLLAIGEDDVTFRFRGQDRTIKRERVVGIVPADAPARRLPARGYCVTTANGSTICGAALKPGWLLQSELGELPLRKDRVQQVAVRTPRVQMLHDLVPAAEDYGGGVTSPLWDRHWAANMTLTGEPMVLDGRNWDAGVAMHAPCRLTYALAPGTTTFVARVALDGRLGKAGDCVVRVLADGQPRFEAHLQSSGEGHLVRVDLTGAERLELAVEAGPNFDLGDHVNWANARLLRTP